MQPGPWGTGQPGEPACQLHPLHRGPMPGLPRRQSNASGLGWGTLAANSGEEEQLPHPCCHQAAQAVVLCLCGLAPRLRPSPPQAGGAAEQRLTAFRAPAVPGSELTRHSAFSHVLLPAGQSWDTPLPVTPGDPCGRGEGKQPARIHRAGVGERPGGRRGRGTHRTALCLPGEAGRLRPESERCPMGPSGTPGGQHLPHRVSA